jgi:hypothetical protein
MYCRGVYRPVPDPPEFLDTLNLVHNLQAVKKRKDRGREITLGLVARHGMDARL